VFNFIFLTIASQLMPYLFFHIFNESPYFTFEFLYSFNILGRAENEVRITLLNDELSHELFLFIYKILSASTPSKPYVLARYDLKLQSFRKTVNLAPHDITSTWLLPQSYIF